MATLKPTTPLHVPEQQPLKPPSPLRPKTAPKQPISHLQRRWRFQSRLGRHPQRRWRFQTGPPGRQGQAAVPTGSNDTTASQISHVIYRGHFSRHPKNVAIPTMQIQCLNKSQGNYVRNWWAAVGPGRASRERARPHPSSASAASVDGAGGICRGAGGRWRGLAGLRDDAPSQSSAHPAPLVWRAPEGPEGTGGLRGAAPNEVRTPSLAGGRTLRHPEHPWGHKHQKLKAAAHRHTQRPGPPAPGTPVGPQATRPSRQPATTKTRRPRRAARAGTVRGSG